MRVRAQTRARVATLINSRGYDTKFRFILSFSLIKILFTPQPAIVKVLDAVDTPETLYIVLEL
jgi:hypothetical protein